MTASTSAPASTNAWTDLEQGCSTALDLSRDVSLRLESGASATDLVPLLQREHEAISDLRDGIAAIVGSPPAGSAGRRDDIVRQLSELMEIDGRNRELLSRRGVHLRGPRQRRWR